MRLMSIRSLPNPRITTSSPPWPGSSGAAGGAGLGARLVHERAHAADGTVEPAENGLTDQEMTDVQLGDGGDDCDSTDSIEGKAMPGMAFQAKIVSQGRSLANAREGGFSPLPLRILEVGVAECPGL